MTTPVLSYLCPVCDEDVTVTPDAPITAMVVCLHCHALLLLDTDADFVGGLWQDRSTLRRVLPPLPLGSDTVP